MRSFLCGLRSFTQSSKQKGGEVLRSNETQEKRNAHFGSLLADQDCTFSQEGTSASKRAAQPCVLSHQARFFEDIKAVHVASVLALMLASPLCMLLF